MESRKISELSIGDSFVIYDSTIVAYFNTLGRIAIGTLLSKGKKNRVIIVVDELHQDESIARKIVFKDINPAIKVNYIKNYIGVPNIPRHLMKRIFEYKIIRK